MLKIERTTHRILLDDCKNITLEDTGVGGIDLIVTSPPYPMVEMWDECFSRMVGFSDNDNPVTACKRMCFGIASCLAPAIRLLKEGGFICINIGDAVRTVGGTFSLYPSHSFLQQGLMLLDEKIVPLPTIFWKKATNAPNKFMGSGMLPCGAYATMEHEFILIFRKGGKREFKTKKEKDVRKASAFFWDERNTWFSDEWNVTGTSQSNKDGGRKRNASFPMEIPYRLINMYSCIGDMVYDPFGGLGTTMVAAMESGRNSLMSEIDNSLKKAIINNVNHGINLFGRIKKMRLDRQMAFLWKRENEGKGPAKYLNRNYGIPVMTRQETEIVIPKAESFGKPNDLTYFVAYDNQD